MSHPDPCYDPDNSYEDDMNYDDYNDFFDNVDAGNLEYGEVEADELEDSWDDSYDDSMDGDHESGLASAGWGTDEDYGYYGDDTAMSEDY
jgi:hypothetical protein